MTTKRSSAAPRAVETRAGCRYPIPQPLYETMLKNDVRPWLALTLWRDESAQDPSLFVIAESIARIFFEACDLW